MKPKVTKSDYPLYEKNPDLIKTLSGKTLDDINVESILKGDIVDKDTRISPGTLILQAEIAKKEGRLELAKNFLRAAELCRIPDEEVLKIYNALRPHRSSKLELEMIAECLEVKYRAIQNANLIREAIIEYEERSLLKKKHN